MGKPERYAEVLARIAGAAPESKYIRAYHGSPHDFDRFDASKIGTGEGAQAYGHGLYFAGNEAVGKGYREALSADRDVLIGGLPSVEHLKTLRAQGKAGRSPEWMAVNALREYAPGAQGVDDLFDSAIGYYPEDTASLLNALDDLRRKGVVLGPQPGHMYEVEIAHPESSYLDFDAPMSAQQPDVMAALRKFDAVPELPASVPWEPTGQHAYRRLIELRLANARNAPRKASEMLAAEGVPGIRYLDGYSRGAGAGTNNYVMFPGTEDSIRILRKYAVPGAIGAGAAGGMQDQPQSRPSPSY